MNDNMKSMIKDAMILFAITLMAGLILGTVYQVTKDPIAKQKEKAKQEACKEVFADAAGFELIDQETLTGKISQQEWTDAGFSGVSIGEVMQASDASGSSLGYVITVTSHEGYGGDISYMLGVQKDGTLNGISILSIAETAGLGMRAEEILKPQFTDKQVESFESVKSGAMSDSQIDAISGATITTDAMISGVNAGLYYFKTVLGGGSGNE